MSIKAGYATPLFHVAEIERSIEFYQLLGFDTVDTDRCEPLGWARLHCEGGAIMLLRAEEPVDAAQQGVALYMYTPGLVDLQSHLQANDVATPEIRHPEYMPSGEILLHDPDGYAVFIAHWGEAEHSAWLERTNVVSGIGTSLGPD